MNKDTLFPSIILNTIHIDCVTVDNTASIEAFSEKNCFHESLQPMLEARSLSLLVESMADNVFYEFSDSLGVSTLLFKYNDHSYIVGPFVTKKFNDSDLELQLLKKKIPSSYLIPLKLYYTNLGIISSFYVQSFINGILTAFENRPIEYTYRRLQGLDTAEAPSNLREEAPIDYDTIYLRYERENALLKIIRTGDLSGLASAFDEATAGMLHTKDPYFERNDNNAFSMYSKSPLIGAALMRGMARKAAEEGGLSIIKIDSITQHYTQLMNACTEPDQISILTYKLIYELTSEVHKNQFDASNLSAPIAKVLEYISLNYSQDIQIDYLAQLAGFSETHLSKKFKKETDMTIIAAITKYRLEKAAELLTTSDLPIQEISMYVGYLDNNYFVKVFKKGYGLTPSQYRQNNKE